MPILAKEVSLFPESLLAESVDGPYGNELDDNELYDSGHRWWALHTRPRQEKSLARELVRFDTAFYLPLVRNKRIVRGRSVRSFIPLFGGYVFMYGNDDQRVKSLTTNRVVRAIEVADGARLRADLRQVQRLIEAGAPLTVEARLKPGHRVRIKQGSMMGLEGTVLARRRRTRLVVAVAFLQRGVSVEVEDCTLEPLD